MMLLVLQDVARQWRSKGGGQGPMPEHNLRVGNGGCLIHMIHIVTKYI